jgi:L-aspartate oxidase
MPFEPPAADPSPRSRSAPRNGASVTTDFLVVGCGIAGLRAAIELAQDGARVLVITKDNPIDSNTWEAQGGIAAALSEEDDVALHHADTLVAGDGLCDAMAVGILVEEGPRYITELISWGMEFDRDGARLAFTREGAHSARRILHAGGDSTGRAIAQALLSRARTFPTLTLQPQVFTVDLLLDEQGRCGGMRCLDEQTGEPFDIRARAVLLATGGCGRLFRETTNPPQATGDGMAIAWRAGAVLMDMEFVQFHPTALHLPDTPSFLLSEALRGEGAYLRNIHGERFLAGVHPQAELAPRDVVSRAIVAEVARTSARCAYLDLTHLDAERLPARFPKIFETCLRFGIDIRRDLIPVYPAAHYAMGGVRTDLHGRTDLAGLYAAGEVACTGVHGANRLASNSLLEGLVFGGRAAQALRGDAPPEPPARPLPPAGDAQAVRATQARLVSDRIAETMWTRVGVVRDGDDLRGAGEEFERLARRQGSHSPTRRGLEARNLLLLAQAIAAAALSRTESRGAHYRRDFPTRDDVRWLRHSVAPPRGGPATG